MLNNDESEDSLKNEENDYLADYYGKALLAGQKMISKSWGILCVPTKKWLNQTEHYTEDGRRKAKDYYNDHTNEVEVLEYNLGVLVLCTDEKLPGPSETEISISSNSFSDEILNSISLLLDHPHGKTSVFLRKAMEALIHQQIAKSIDFSAYTLKYDNSTLGKVAHFLFFLFVALLVLSAPLAIGFALVSASQGIYLETILALYGLGFTLLMVFNLKNRFKDYSEKSLTRQKCEAWHYLKSHIIYGGWMINGAGVLAYLNRMLERNLDPPLLAFDLCEAIKSKTL